MTIGGVRYRDLPEPTAVVGALLEANAFHPGRSGRNHLRVLADAAGVPHLLLEMEQTPSVEALRTRLQAFVEML